VRRTPNTQGIRERIDKWDCIKLKSFCTSEETITKSKKQPMENLCQLFKR
jgi:hypothetical protein